jgi:hypothetical protein
MMKIFKHDRKILYLGFSFDDMDLFITIEMIVLRPKVQKNKKKFFVFWINQEYSEASSFAIGFLAIADETKFR